MTLPTTISAVTYAGNGAATQFDWTFLIPSGALEVYRTENDIAVLVDASAYSASGLDDSNGGTVTFAEAPASGQTITIKRNVALTQDVALVTGSAFYAEVVEGAFDRATMQIQQLAEEMGRAIQVPIGSDVDPADYLDAAAQSAAAAAGSASSAATAAGNAMAAQAGSEEARDEAVAARDAIALPLPIASGGTGATTASAARDNLGVTEAIAAVGMPVGSVMMLYGDDSEAPPGYLLMNGAAVTATYPELRAFGLARGWQVNAGGDPLLPDMGGYFPRGWRSGQLVDRGRVFGTPQTDAIRNITGSTLPGFNYNDLNTTTGVFAKGGAAGSTNSGGAVAFNNVLFDASRVVPTASENRPANVTFTFWIKAYPAQVDTGSIDLAELTNDIQGVSARTTALEEIAPIGQAIYDRTSSRALNTTYTNPTDRVILVSVIGYLPGAGSALTVLLNGAVYSKGVQNTAGLDIYVQFPVPPRGTYKVETSGAGSITLTAWREML